MEWGLSFKERLKATSLGLRENSIEPFLRPVAGSIQTISQIRDTVEIFGSSLRLFGSSEKSLESLENLKQAALAFADDLSRMYLPLTQNLNELSVAELGNISEPYYMLDVKLRQSSIESMFDLRESSLVLSGRLRKEVSEFDEILRRVHDANTAEELEGPFSVPDASGEELFQDLSKDFLEAERDFLEAQRSLDSEIFMQRMPHMAISGMLEKNHYMESSFVIHDILRGLSFTDEQIGQYIHFRNQHVVIDRRQFSKIDKSNLIDRIYEIDEYDEISEKLSEHMHDIDQDTRDSIIKTHIGLHRFLNELVRDTNKFNYEFYKDREGRAARSHINSKRFVDNVIDKLIKIGSSNQDEIALIARARIDLDRFINQLSNKLSNNGIVNVDKASSVMIAHIELDRFINRLVNRLEVFHLDQKGAPSDNSIDSFVSGLVNEISAIKEKPIDKDINLYRFVSDLTDRLDDSYANQTKIASIREAAHVELNRFVRSVVVRSVEFFEETAQQKKNLKIGKSQIFTECINSSNKVLSSLGQCDLQLEASRRILDFTDENMVRAVEGNRAFLENVCRVCLQAQASAKEQKQNLIHNIFKDTCLDSKLYCNDKVLIAAIVVVGEFKRNGTVSDSKICMDEGMLKYLYNVARSEVKNCSESGSSGTDGPILNRKSSYFERVIGNELIEKLKFSKVIAEKLVLAQHAIGSASLDRHKRADGEVDGKKISKQVARIAKKFYKTIIEKESKIGFFRRLATRLCVNWCINTLCKEYWMSGTIRENDKFNLMNCLNTAKTASAAQTQKDIVLTNIVKGNDVTPQADSQINSGRCAVDFEGISQGHGEGKDSLSSTSNIASKPDCGSVGSSQSSTYIEEMGINAIAGIKMNPQSPAVVESNE